MIEREDGMVGVPANEILAWQQALGLYNKGRLSNGLSPLEINWIAPYDDPDDSLRWPQLHCEGGINPVDEAAIRDHLIGFVALVNTRQVQGE